MREQARRGRIPHLRLGKGRIRLLPGQVDVLVALFSVEGHGPTDERGPGHTKAATRGERYSGLGVA